MQLVHAFFRDLPNRTIKFDYGTRTDGQAEYIGHAEKGTGTTEAAWVIFKFSFSGNNVIQVDSVQGGIWDSRSGYF